MSPAAALLIAVGALALAAFAYRRLGPGATAGAAFVLTVEEAGVRLEGTVPGKADNESQEFVERMELPVGAKLWGYPDGRLGFSREVPDNLRQRSRNFFGVV